MDDATDTTGPDEPGPQDRNPSVGDTQAFKAFYLEEPTPPPRRSLGQRLLGLFRRGD